MNIKNSKEYLINIADQEIGIYVDEEFNGIKKFITDLGAINKNITKSIPSIYISKTHGRSVEISDDWNTLYIGGDDINDLADPFTLIGLAQAIFRFTGIHSSNKGIFLLHGSSVKLEDKTICFGDDGSSSAKTLSSIEVGLVSKEYIADEFCFLNTTTSKITGYSRIPIHLRPEVKEHLEITHGIKFLQSTYKNTMAGYFLDSDEIFKTVSGDLDILAYTHFSTTESKILKLDTPESLSSLKFCIAAHIAKLLYPELDRMQFASMTDSNELKEIDEKIVNEICDKLSVNQCLTEFIEETDSYKLIIKEPCEITPLLKAEF